MPERLITKPQAGEYAPYASDYVNVVPDDGRVLQHLAEGFDKIKAQIAGLSDSALSTPWQAGEWTIKEILMHVMDTERVFSYRALRVARNDTTPLSGFNQDPYVTQSGANTRPLESLLAEYEAIRQATLHLYNSFSDEALMRVGTASNHAVSVRALVYMTTGHELHHYHSLRENYGG